MSHCSLPEQRNMHREERAICICILYCISAGVLWGIERGAGVWSKRHDKFIAPLECALAHCECRARVQKASCECMQRFRPTAQALHLFTACALLSAFCLQRRSLIREFVLLG